MEVRNFLNGNFVDSFSKQNIRVVNPADQTDVGFIDEALDDEIEFVPYKVGDFIAKSFDLFVIGMGSGQGCDAQYLFSEDLLGYNKSHIPRHSKVYTDLSENCENIMQKSVKAYKSFKSEIENKIYPETKHDIEISDGEFSNFIKNK